MNTNAKKELIFLVILCIATIVYLIASYDIKDTGTLAGSSAMFPQLIATLIFIMLGFVAFEIFKGKTYNVDLGFIKNPRVISTFVILLAYVLSFDTIGYLISTFLYLGLQIYILDNQKKMKMPIVWFSALIMTGFFYYVFAVLMEINIPHGILKNVLF